MKSISEIIAQLRLLAQSRSVGSSGERLEVQTNFVQPTLHVDVVSNAFEGINTDARFDRLQGWINELDLAEPAQLGDAMARMPVTFNALTQEEASAKKTWINSSGHASWVSSFLEEPLAQASKHDSETQKYVHFYGYKGGQGRSTVLALLAKALADDGYRVLLVDADIEAPSLDLLFDVSADSFAQTLMGLCGWATECRPLAAAYAGRLEGRVDLLPCRPRNADADLDFALLVATAPVDSRIYQRAAEKLQAALLKRDEAYDVVLVDHRTGIASSVLPLMRQLPGTAAVFARIDFNTSSVPSELRRVVRAIFSSTSWVPGAFVSFSLDPNRATTAAKSPAEARVREVLLGELASVMEMMDGNELPTQIPTTDLSLNWIDWYHDRSLLEPTLPDVAKLQADNIASLNLLREALAVPIGHRPQPLRKNGDRSSTSLSGARDAGQFIHIPEIEKLFVPGNPYSYILGRKGTGKTRLLREMAERGLGTPLLVAADQTDTVGLQSLSIEAQEWLKRCEYDAPTFWWSLIRVGIERPGNTPISEMLRDYAL